MAKIQVMMAVTLNGFLPETEDALFQWVKTDKQGFALWHAKSTLPLFPHYPLVGLSREKEVKDSSHIYLAEISDPESASLLRGLFVYSLVDEIILYLLPVIIPKGIFILDAFTPSNWELTESRRFRNGICRMVYRKVLQ